MPSAKKLTSDFDKKVLATAKKIVRKYEVILAFEDDRWYGKGLEMPNVFGDGKTPNECIENTMEALTAAVAHLLERGETVPAPAVEGKRTEQINIRLTAEEKAILTATAKSKGYRGIGDYIRTHALAAS